MTTIHYSGSELFMGAGLICREPGDYTVEDSTAELLLANESELFSPVVEEPAEAPHSEADETPEETEAITPPDEQEPTPGVEPVKEPVAEPQEAPEATVEPAQAPAAEEPAEAPAAAKKGKK